MRTSRAEEARLDYIVYESNLRQAGLIEPDQPTPLGHERYLRRVRAEFTPLERQMIRASLGLADCNRRNRPEAAE